MLPAIIKNTIIMRNTNQVYGVSNELIDTYIQRKNVDETFLNGLQKNKHIVIYGASKQGKTSLTNKHLSETDYIKVNCSPTAGTLDIYSSIVRQLNLEIIESNEVSTTVGGEAKIGLKAKIRIPFFGGADAESEVSVKGDKETTLSYKVIDFNLALAQDLSELLKNINFQKRIILENFHYLNEDVQKQLSIDLRIFEDYNILFIILGIWREKNRLSQFNGDLLDRIIEVPVEPWEKVDLKKIVDEGLPLLNVDLTNVVDYIIESCFDSVGVFQEICKESCYAAGYSFTQETTQEITVANVDTAITKKLLDYSSRHTRCLESFIEQKARSSQETPLYIPYYFVKVLFQETIENIILGLKRKTLQEKIKEIHHRPDDVRPSDMGYFLKNLVASQITKNISPPIFDFDNSTTSVKIIDSTFYFFIKNCDRAEVIENLLTPEGLVE
jgi:Cdc6-like AAA superfamily ATPase